MPGSSEQVSATKAAVTAVKGNRWGIRDLRVRGGGRGEGCLSQRALSTISSIWQIVRWSCQSRLCVGGGVTTCDGVESQGFLSGGPLKIKPKIWELIVDCYSKSRC